MSSDAILNAEQAAAAQSARRAAPPLSAANRFRAARFRRFRAMVEDVLAQRGACRILDVGGLEEYWRSFGPDLVSDRRVHITLVNLDYSEADLPSMPGENFERHVGDARSLAKFPDSAFDLAHSNSVIEHVGLWSDQVAMAAELRRAARQHYVQTPYWGFPLEPHFRTPLFHWLPEQARYRLMLRTRLGFFPRAATVDAAMRSVQNSYMLDRKQFQSLFPHSTIYSERAYGLTKSLIAVGGEGLVRDARSNRRGLLV